SPPWASPPPSPSRPWPCSCSCHPPNCGKPYAHTALADTPQPPPSPTTPAPRAIMTTVSTTQHTQIHPGTQLALPPTVQDRLEQVTHSVIIDTRTLHRVRERFDTHQAHTLGRYLANAQSANTVRAYRTDWTTFTAWCLAEKRQSLPADPVDVAVYLAACAHTRTPDNTAWALAPSTLERRAAAIAAVHGAHGLASPTRSEVVRMTLRGIRR